MCRILCKKGEQVEILPKIHHKDNLYTQIFGDLVGTKYAGKCPDLKVNGKFYEYEGIYIKKSKRTLFGICLNTDTNNQVDSL